MMKFFLTTLLFLLFTVLIFAQVNIEKEKLFSPHTLKENRDSFKNNLLESTIKSNLSIPLNNESEEKWIGAFWGIKISLFNEDFILKKLNDVIIDYHNRSEEFRRSFLEVIYTVFPDDFTNDVIGFLQRETSKKNFVMCINYLLKSKDASISSDELLEILLTKFDDVLSHPILFMLYHKLSGTLDENNIERPSLTSLLSHTFENNKTVIFSLQRKNRDFQGLTIIRKPDGTFLRSKNDSLFYIKQLARAISNLPGYLTNGNTPQGIFSIQGIDTSSNIFIGPTPNIQLVLPFEASVENYFHNKSKINEEWSLKIYQNLLPEEWQHYLPVFEAFYAGKAGRNEIIAHGTTVDPIFYKDKSYYPNTPTLGCLCATEIWSEESGTLIKSDQLKLMNSFLSLGVQEGYFVVIELDDKEEDVKLNEVFDIIIEAEKIIHK